MSFESVPSKSEVMGWNSGNLVDYLKKVSMGNLSYFSFDKKQDTFHLNILKAAVNVTKFIM